MLVIKWIDKMSSKNYSKNEWLILSEHIWSEWKMERWDGRRTEERKKELRKKREGRKSRLGIEEQFISERNKGNYYKEM